MSREWTTDEVTAARRMRDSGMAWGDIGSKLDRTGAAVRSRVWSVTPPVALKSKEDAGRIRQLERLVEKQAEALERSRAPRVRLPSRQSSKTQSGDFTRVIIPDSHGCHIDPEAAAAFLSDLEALRPREIIMLGDHLDCGGFLAQHHTMGFVAETEYSFDDDVGACNQFLDEIQRRAPGAEILYLEGNHERRIEKWCVTQALANQKDANLLRRMFSTEAVLSLEKRGVKIFKQGVKYDGLPIPATIKRGKCHFTHSDRCSVHAAAAILSAFGGNVVYGHTHRADSFTRRTVTGGVIGAWNPGCLCKLQPYWNHTAITGHSHGYAIQFQRESEEFLHVNVPIIDGKSLLVPLTKLVS